MPLNADLLNPIPGDSPGGANLRYDPVYDKIKEARRQDDDAIPQGEWQRELKKADWPLVIKLCSEALSKRTKDLQLAAWLTEALIRRQGFAGLQEGLELLRGLIEQFWESLYPEIEDGDMEMRAVPLDWLGSRSGDSLREVPLTKNGLGWLKYKESRSVGYEADAADSDSKREAREQAIADGKLTGEEFDKAFAATPKSFYQQQVSEIDGCLQAVESLAQISEARFEDFNPSFSGLQESLQTVRQAVRELLARKRETEPDEEVIPAEAVAEEEAAPEVVEAEEVAAPAPASTIKRTVKKAVPIGEPADRQDAYARVAALAEWLRKEDPYNPVPYLMVRAMRWGELRAAGTDLDANLLEAPSTEVRTRIKQLLNDGNYDELFPVLEEAAAQACGRGWLDLQRYFCKACDDAGGYDYVKQAVTAELAALLADYPTLPELMLLDDTPAANPETRTWLQALLAARVPAACDSQAQALSSPPPAMDDEESPDCEAGEIRPPDVFELAQQALRSGRTDEAIGLLTREAAQERSGRARFQRKVQLAQICVAAGHEAVAHPILEGLAEEMESRQLEDWESPDVLAHALGLLFRCVGKLQEDSELKQKLYARICRLDPVQALELTR